MIGILCEVCNRWVYDEQFPPTMFENEINTLSPDDYPTWDETTYVCADCAYSAMWNLGIDFSHPGLLVARKFLVRIKELPSNSAIGNGQCHICNSGSFDFQRVWPVTFVSEAITFGKLDYPSPNKVSTICSDCAKESLENIGIDFCSPGSHGNRTFAIRLEEITKVPI